MENLHLRKIIKVGNGRYIAITNLVDWRDCYVSIKKISETNGVVLLSFKKVEDINAPVSKLD